MSAVTSQDDYGWWYAALAAVARGERVTISERTPHCGYYAYKLRTGRTPSGSTRYPVVVWIENGKFWAKVGYADDAAVIQEEAAADRWTEYGSRPITHEVYVAACQAGRFADDLPDERAPKPPTAPPPAHTSDGVERRNSDAANPVEALRDQIDANVAAARKVVSIADEDACRAVQSQRARLLELAGEADKAREKEKAPHWEKCKAVDAKWQPLVKDAKWGADHLRSAMSAFVNEQDRKARLAVAQREALDRAAAQQASAEAEAAAAMGQPPPPPPKPVEQPDAPVVPLKVKGGYGRAASVKAVKRAVIGDYPAFVGALLAGRFGQEAMDNLKGILDGTANLLARAGVSDMPGVIVNEEKAVQ
jgi:hypothetical protein